MCIRDRCYNDVKDQLERHVHVTNKEVVRLGDSNARSNSTEIRKLRGNLSRSKKKAENRVLD